MSGNPCSLAASQLVRIRERNIPLTVCVDKVAASGGYLMACVADKIVAAPFAIQAAAHRDSPSGVVAPQTDTHVEVDAPLAMHALKQPASPQSVLNSQTDAQVETDTSFVAHSSEHAYSACGVAVPQIETQVDVLTPLASHSA